MTYSEIANETLLWLFLFEEKFLSCNQGKVCKSFDIFYISFF